jgi:hypothetical protein
MLSLFVVEIALAPAGSLSDDLSFLLSYGFKAGVTSATRIARLLMRQNFTKPSHFVFCCIKNMACQHV